MGLEASLRVINEMQDAGVLSEYAIGGAVAAFFYIEPAATFDLDIFIVWKPREGGLLTPHPLYQYLANQGYDRFQSEAVIIEGWAVQFLPLGTPLIEEALSEAVEIVVKGVGSRAFTKEHLMAICLQTGRAKDLARLVQFVNESSPDMAGLEKILERHKLLEAWDRFRVRYLS